MKALRLSHLAMRSAVLFHVVLLEGLPYSGANEIVFPVEFKSVNLDMKNVFKHVL